MRAARAIIGTTIAAGLITLPSRDAPGDEGTIEIRAPKEVRGDGRTLLPIEVVSTASQDPGRRAEVACDGVAAFVSQDDQAPAILPPAVTTPTPLACTVRRGELERRFEVVLRPAADGLYAVAEPAHVRTGAAPIEIRALGLGDELRNAATGARTGASEGKITSTGPGGWSLELTPTTAPRTVAIAMSDGVHHAATFIPVTGVTRLPIESQTGSRVEVRVGDRWFGPVAVKRRLVHVPIEVPPGVRRAAVRQTDARGYVLHTVADLKIPDQPRVAAATAAEATPAGGLEIAVALVGVDGRPGDGTETLTARAEHGAVGLPRSLGQGLWVIPYRAPTEAGVDRVTVGVSGAPSAGEAIAEITVVASRAPLAATSVTPARTPIRIGLGAYGDLDRLAESDGVIAGWRIGGGLGAGHSFGRLDVSLLVGAELLSFDDEVTMDLAGAEREVHRSVLGLAVPLMARARLPIYDRYGAWAGVGVVPMRATVEIGTDFQESDRYSELVLGMRLRLAVDAALGPGKLWLGGGWGSASLDDGPLVGRFEGIGLGAGYEWWFQDVRL